MKNQSSKILSLSSLALAACVALTSLSANAYSGSIGDANGGDRRGGGFEDNREGGRRGGRGDGRIDRGSRRGDLRDRREVERLVNLMYQGALFRNADRAGLHGFSREILNRGHQGLYDSARMIGSSPEFAELVRYEGAEQVVYNMYRVFFNRLPDRVGLHDWSNLLDQGRGGDVLHGIVASPEFYQNQL